jgi:hypothetical protein
MVTIPHIGSTTLTFLAWLKLCTLWSTPSVSPSSNPGNHFSGNYSVSMSLTFLDTTFRYNHTVFALLCPIYLNSFDTAFNSIFSCPPFFTVNYLIFNNLKNLSFHFFSVIELKGYSEENWERIWEKEQFKEKCIYRSVSTIYSIWHWNSVLLLLWK